MHGVLSGQVDGEERKGKERNGGGCGNQNWKSKEQKRERERERREEGKNHSLRSLTLSVCVSSSIIHSITK